MHSLATTFTLSRPVLLPLLSGGLTLALSNPFFAQGAGMTSPGTSRYSSSVHTSSGQTSRFTSEFNPGLGCVIDAVVDYADPGEGASGGDVSLRIFELNINAFIDPSAWAYVVVTSHELESLGLEEAAVAYIGFEGHSTLRAGRFFVDFGKQMQTHLEELRTLERPIVLREFLGDELGGTGVQYDTWFPAGDVPIRFSLGAFSNLFQAHEHGAEEPEPGGGTEPLVPSRKDLDEFSLTARLTGLMEAGERGTFQLGASLRHIPEFTFAYEADETLDRSGMANSVFGLDATYGWASDTGIQTFLGGLEVLAAAGDLAAAVDDPGDPGELVVQDDSAAGYYAYADYGWTQYDSAGMQYSRVEAPEDPDATLSELDLYATHHFTEFRRLRLGVTLADSDESGSETRVYLQFTNFFGSHAHGINW
ncbi:MAG: hypothetical protein AB1726_13910 [Planctomycetota bacterium]